MLIIDNRWRGVTRIFFSVKVPWRNHLFYFREYSGEGLRPPNPRPGHVTINDSWNRNSLSLLIREPGFGQLIWITRILRMYEYPVRIERPAMTALGFDSICGVFRIN